MLRSKREEFHVYELCKPFPEVREDLAKCDRNQWITKCIPESEYVICSNNQDHLQAGKCLTEISDFRCCVLDCP